MANADYTVTDNRESLTVSGGGVDLLTYVVHPDTRAEEAPKPYLFPLRFLDGGEAAVRRPWDHRWHTGLQFTWSHVKDQNFWGGPTFSKEGGYQMQDNLGRMEHQGFAAPPADGSDVVLDETLKWINARGEHWYDEHRVHRIHSLDPERGLWSVDLTTTLTNVSGETLPMGSPTTAGRDQAGYTGWFWRGPRSWTGARVVSSAGLEGDEAVMGTTADWIAMQSEHDGIDGGGTILTFSGSSEAAAGGEALEIPEIRWFVRSGNFAVISPSPAFYEEIHLPHEGTLTLNHRYVFVSRVCDDAELEALGAEFAL
ncbi:PmoA family protein [Zhihengliuella salsuginis]|uniref:Oxidoreductase n=1 Tax=Zhihengliuella salsuginis TaxID=578222 RepID=A0ABQ3GHW0_9MICC|nr:PmoA family protein [Zhihengliuella salsuginis]GHD05516.1 oxidoreductase [Zhihengliuella salsuginis]